MTKAKTENGVHVSKVLNCVSLPPHLMCAHSDGFECYTNILFDSDAIVQQDGILFTFVRSNVSFLFPSKSNCFRRGRDKETGITFIFGRLYCFVNYLFSLSTMPNASVVQVMASFFSVGRRLVITFGLYVMSQRVSCCCCSPSLRFHFIGADKQKHSTQYNCRTIPFSVCDSSF